MNIIRNMLGAAAAGAMVIACAATVDTRPAPRYDAREECRTVKVHNGREVEECHTRCHDDRCHSDCREHERVARERRCWVE